MPARVSRMNAGIAVNAERDDRQNEVRELSEPEIGSQAVLTPNT